MVETWNLDLLNDLNTSQIGCFILQPQKIQFLSYPLRVSFLSITSHHHLGLPQRNGRLGIPGIAAPPHHRGLDKEIDVHSHGVKKLEVNWKIQHPKLSKKKLSLRVLSPSLHNTYIGIKYMECRFGRRYHVEVDGFLQSNIFHQRQITIIPEPEWCHLEGHSLTKQAVILKLVTNQRERDPNSRVVFFCHRRLVILNDFSQALPTGWLSLVDCVSMCLFLRSCAISSLVQSNLHANLQKQQQFSYLKSPRKKHHNYKSSHITIISHLPKPEKKL